MHELHDPARALTPASADGSGAEPYAGARQLSVRLDHLDEGCLCVRVAGELDLATTEELSSRMSDVLTEARDVVLDLGGVTFMDSTGLAAIVSAIHRAQDTGAELRIASPLPPQPQRLLELTGVLDHLSFAPNPPGLTS